MAEEKKEVAVEQKKKMTTKEAVVFWACNAVTLCVSVLLLVLVWIK